MQLCQILWFLMKVKPKTKNKFCSRHIMIYDKRSLGTIPSEKTQIKYYWLNLLTIYSIVLSKLLKNWAALLSSLCVDTSNKLSRWYQPLCVMVLYTFREERRDDHFRVWTEENQTYIFRNDTCIFSSSKDPCKGPKGLPSREETCKSLVIYKSLHGYFRV